MLAVALLLGALGFVLGSTTSSRESTDYNIVTARKMDVQGHVHHLGIENKRAYPVCLVFLEVGCVVSQRMIPELNSIYSEAIDQNIRLYGVISNHKATWQEAQTFQKEFDIKFPMLFDANGDLAAQIGPSMVPQAFLFDNKDHLKYQGRINDLFVAVGKINKHPRHNDLIDAMNALANGAEPTTAQTNAVGCIFEPWPVAGDRDLTYNKDIEPIFRANCATCHRPNDIAPFSLLTYEDASRRGRMIEFTTRKGYMPIWKAEEGYGTFSNEHRLSQYQKDLIGKWVKTGMKEGSVEALVPKPATTHTEWKLGQPDLILQMEAYDLPANGEDQYRVFVMEGKIPRGKTISAVDFKPGDPAVVHHSTIFLDYTGVLSAYDKEDPKPGYDAFEKGGTMEFGSAVSVCGWAPGVGPYSYPEGVGFYVENDAQIAFENHYHLTGKATTDQSYIGIYYADKPVEKYITGSIIGTQRLQIPANESKYEKTVWTYVPADIELYDLTPHMHYIGKEVTVDAVLPNGDVKPLLHLTDWDLRWQSVYTLRELTRIPKGSILKAHFVFDNSDDNADNPYYPSQEMYWGWGSNDEMCEVYFSYVPVSNKDYGKMMAASFASFEHFYPYNERIEISPENLDDIYKDYINCDVWSDNGQKLQVSIVESRLASEVIRLMKREKSKYHNDPGFWVNLSELALADAMSTLVERDINSAANEAGTQLYKFLKTDHWNVHMTYGRLMLTSGSSTYEKEGISILKALIDKQEKQDVQKKFAKAYWELAKYYYAIDEDAMAETVLKRGLKRHPDNVDLNQELASGGRIVKKSLN